MKQPTLQKYPTMVSIEVTNKCNLNCLACCHEETVSRGIAKNMSMHIYERILPIISNAENVMLFGYGEPFLNPNIMRMVSLAKQNSEAKIRVNTNGTLLTKKLVSGIVKSGLNELVFSIDGVTQNTFGKLRDGADLAAIIHYIRSLIREKANCQATLRVGIEFVAMRNNIQELPRLILLASKLGVTFVQVSYLTVKCKELEAESLFYSQNECDAIFDVAENISETCDIQLCLPARFRDTFSHRSHNHCRQPWSNAFFGCTGEVYVCCTGGRLYRAGNIQARAWEDIWNGPMYQRIRSMHLQNKIEGPCKHCFFSTPHAVSHKSAHIRLDLEKRRKKHRLEN